MISAYPPNLPPLVWRRFVAKVEQLEGFACPALWSAPPRDDGYGQFWVPREAERLLGEPELAGYVMDGQGELFPLPGKAAETEMPHGKGRPWRAHRVAYAAWYGPIGPDDVVMHRCDRPLCTPITRADVDAHLQLGTWQANAEDREVKGRTVARREYGLMAWGRSDRRGPYRRSLALHQALTAGRDAGMSGVQLAALVRAADDAGTPLGDELPLPSRITIPDMEEL